MHELPRAMEILSSLALHTRIACISVAKLQIEHLPTLVRTNAHTCAQGEYLSDQKINSEVKISRTRAALFAPARRRRARFHDRSPPLAEAQNLASNFLGTLTRSRVHIEAPREAPTNILLPADKHVLSHTPVSRTGTTLSHRIARRHAPTFLPLFFSLGRPRGEDSFARGSDWRGKDTLYIILLPSRLPPQAGRRGGGREEGDDDDDDDALKKAERDAGG
ncbi:hypothetical protein DBV15_02657 [Temnothorax longispinosus]|uniref:Uncharacterized protein n=1 Tax=Temnothorax longispinosus TaxID=300112 RepID=A0A4S2KE52_9HYME|nr:hypothetical protein DBV15_02657 [Temnothorax longispinosus]